MYKGLSILLLFVLVGTYSGQTPQPGRKQPSKRSKAAVKKVPAVQTDAAPADVMPAEEPKASPTPEDLEPDRTRFDKAVAAATTADKARFLRAFLADFPDSELRPEAFSYLVTARAIVGNEKIKAGETAEGIASFKLAVEEVPDPVPDRLYNDVILKIPVNLFYGGQQSAAMEIALLIEKKVAANPKQLLSVAAFYLGIENAAEAKRVAEAAIVLEPSSAAGYQALGLAHRLNFDLDEAAKAYAKAIEVEPSSVPAQRSLADMKRALGKADEAASIYRSLVSANENDTAARSGLVLSLFDGGKQAEAEAEFVRATERDPKNFTLLAGAAYWYAVNKQGAKAVEHAQKAIDAEPRYIWSHIALARGLMGQGKPIEAERALIKARQYGNFPTLEYELASARFMAGLYREAVEELAKRFVLKDGMLHTKLGGRLDKEDKSFTDLIAGERRASILQPVAADDARVAEKLKLLLEIRKNIEESPADVELAALADEFVKGDDKMKLHRQLYIAGLLLQKNLALPKVAELIKAAVGNSDAGLDVSAPAAAVMANELYESRTVAFSRNEVVLIPDVPRQTLSAILRGRIEDLAGWTFFQQKNYPEAVVRLKRAVSVLPDKSAWWRSSMWRLGTVLEADGKDQEALDSYIQSYKTDRPSPLRYSVIEAVYQRVNGSTEGLEEKAGAKPGSDAAAIVAQTPDTANPVQTVPGSETAAGTTESKANSNPEKSARQIAPPTIPRVVPAASFDKVKTAAEPAKLVEALKIEPVKIEERADAKEEKAGLKGKTVENKEEKAAAAAEVPASAPAVTEEKKNVDLPRTDPEKLPTTEQDAVTIPKPDTVIEKPAPPIEEKKGPEPEITKPALDPPVKSEEKKPAEPAIETGAPAKVPDLVKKGDGPPTEKKESSTPTSEPPAAESARPDKTEPAPEPQSRVPQSTEQPAAEKPSETVTAPPPDPQKSKLPQIENSAKQTNDTLPPTADPANSVKLKADPPAENNPVEKTETPAAPVTRTAEKKPLVIIEDRLKPRDEPAKTAEKSSGTGLFEPIIIRVPSTWVPKNVPVPAAIDEKQADAEANARPAGSKKGGGDSASGASRRRVIEGKEIVSDRRCSIDVSQEDISLLNAGGSQSVLVTLTGGGDTRDITASVNSQRDILVRPEEDLGGITGRRFYVIKSISPKPGLFQVSFDSPCGKKEVVVRVK